jgi:uncharacterized membrane protein
MLTLPPFPGWQAIHPLVVHFPIALLFVAPIFVVIGVARKPPRSDPFLMAALLLMAMGTIGTFIASSSGEAAAKFADRVPKARIVLDQHEDLAETTELAFTALTLVFASILFVPRAFKMTPARTTSTMLPLVFLIFYATGIISIANTAHQGGRLVHEFGVRAPMLPRAAAILPGGRD